MLRSLYFMDTMQFSFESALQIRSALHDWLFRKGTANHPLTLLLAVIVIAVWTVVVVVVIGAIVVQFFVDSFSR